MYTLVVIIMLAGHKAETSTPVDSLAVCQAQARDITGSKARSGNVFTSKNGSVMAICKPIDENTVAAGIKEKLQ